MDNFYNKTIGSFLFGVIEVVQIKPSEEENHKKCISYISWIITYNKMYLYKNVHLFANFLVDEAAD